MGSCVTPLHCTLLKLEITHMSYSTHSIKWKVQRERKGNQHSPQKSSINPPEYSALETYAEKYLSEQYVINLPKSENTIYFQFSISKVKGWFAGLSTGYKGFRPHGTCSVTTMHELLPSNHALVSHTEVKKHLFSHTQNPAALLKVRSP